MSKTSVNVPNSKGAGVLHNQAIVATGPLVFCSGQVPADLTTGEITKGDVKQHTHQCIQNLKAVLEAAGSSLENAVKVNVFLVDMNDYAAMNEAYVQYWGATKPVRTCVAVRELPRGADVEIECTALLASRAGKPRL